jgi:4-hydroxy-tetrahydrodipicolinate synthase
VSNIIGIKDATADMEQLVHTIDACGARMEFYSGDDATVLPFMALGGHGVISVVANIAPRTMKALTDAMRRDDLSTARDAQFAMRELNRVLFIQSNPIPVKAACHLLGWMSGEHRLPLVPMSGEPLEQVRGAMQGFEPEQLGLGDS